MAGRPPCTVCGTDECPCQWCHIECGLDHSPKLPKGSFPLADLCNPHCPDEAWLPTLVGMPAMQGASMALPIEYLKMQSRRQYLWGGPPNPAMRRIHYHPPRAGEINPMFAAGEWKDTPPDPATAQGIDINRLSGAMQAEITRQIDERRGVQQAPPEMPEKKQFVDHITRFDPRHHTVTEVLAHLRTASPGEVERVFRLEENGSKRAGILKRRNQFPGVQS